MLQNFRQFAIYLVVVGLLRGVVSPGSGVVVANELTPATRADSSTDQWAPATLIVPGKVLEITDGGIGATTWTIIITRVDQTTFHGLADKEWLMGNRSIVSGLDIPKVPSRVEGRVLPNGLAFDVFNYRVEDAREAIDLSCEGKYSQGKWEIEKSQYKQKTKAYLGLGQRISREEAEQKDAARRQAVEQGIKDWQAIRAALTELRSQGHLIDTYGGIQPDGTVALSWSDEAYVDSPQGRGHIIKKLTDYSILSGLPKLERLRSMRISRPMPQEAWQQVRKLRHIGSITFIGRSAPRGISALAGGPTIGALNVTDASPAIVAELGKLDRVAGLSIQLDNNDSQRAGMSVLAPLARMKGLRQLEISNPPKEDPDAIFSLLHDLDALEAFSASVDLTPVGIEHLQSFKKLKSLKIGSMEARDIAKFSHPTVEHLQIRYSADINDSHLVEWTIPPALKSLVLPYWIPGDHLAYAKRLPQMSVREQACYEIVRILPEMYSAIEKAAYGRVELRALAGMFVYSRKADEIPQARSIADDLLDADLTNRRATQRLLGKYMRELAELVLDVSGKLVAEKKMPLENGLAIQRLAYQYCGKWNRDFKSHLTPVDIAACEQQLESLNAVLRELQQ